jgi:hypothetical protein
MIEALKPSELFGLRWRMRALINQRNRRKVGQVLENAW